MKTLTFNHICLSDLKTDVIDVVVAPDNLQCPYRVPPDRLWTFEKPLQDNRVVFSPLILSPHGHSVFYLLRAYADQLLIGAASTAYIVKHGSAVSFGEKVHAAIVD